MIGCVHSTVCNLRVWPWQTVKANKGVVTKWGHFNVIREVVFLAGDISECVSSSSCLVCLFSFIICSVCVEFLCFGLPACFVFLSKTCKAVFLKCVNVIAKFYFQISAKKDTRDASVFNVSL